MRRLRSAVIALAGIGLVPSLGAQPAPAEADAPAATEQPQAAQPPAGRRRARATPDEPQPAPPDGRAGGQEPAEADPAAGPELDFLEYLGSWQGDDEEWYVLAEGEGTLGRQAGRGDDGDRPRRRRERRR